MFHQLLQESNIVKLSEDQMAQLLSAFWVQANLPDNLPANFEALAHSFNLTLVSSHVKVNLICIILCISVLCPEKKKKKMFR